VTDTDVAFMSSEKSKQQSGAAGNWWELTRFSRTWLEDYHYLRYVMLQSVHKL
jgi:hypothetical protein